MKKWAWLIICLMAAYASSWGFGFGGGGGGGTGLPTGKDCLAVRNSAGQAACQSPVQLGISSVRGAKGDAATIAVGTVNTLSPGASATVVNGGSSSAAAFNFGIPAGATGATGLGLSSCTPGNADCGLTISKNTTTPTGASTGATTSSTGVLAFGPTGAVYGCYSGNCTEVGSTYSLPTASNSVLGGVKVGNNLTITNGVLSATSGGSSGGLTYNTVSTPTQIHVGNAYYVTTAADLTFRNHSSVGGVHIFNNTASNVKVIPDSAMTPFRYAGFNGYSTAKGYSINVPSMTYAEFMIVNNGPITAVLATNTLTKTGTYEFDTTPDQFTFTDQTNVATSSTITSAAITVAGINSPSAISVTGGTYDINTSGSFTSSAGTVSNGDQVRARHTSSGSNSTAVNTVVTIGGVSDTFTSTTVAGASYLLDETFTASGLPSGWAAVSGAVGAEIIVSGDGNMVLVPNAGNYTNADVASPSFTASGTAYMGFNLQYSASCASAVTFELRDASNAMVARMRLFGNALVVKSGNGDYTSDYTVSPVTDTYWKVEYVKGTGANSVATLFTSANGTTWTQRATSTNGDATTDVTHVEIFHGFDSACDITFHAVRANNANFNM